jgi:hypothetical protein
MKNRTQFLRCTRARPLERPAPEAAPTADAGFVGEIQMQTGEVFVWVLPDGNRFFGYLPAGDRN